MYKSIISFFLLVFFITPLYAAELYVTGDIRGEIQPCGCSELGDLGGVDRLQQFFQEKQGKTNQRLWVDTGNFSTMPTEQGKLKNQLILKLFRKAQLDAIVPGPVDLAEGIQNLSGIELPWILSNLKGEFKNIQYSIIKNNIQVFGFLSPLLFSKETNQTPYLQDVKTFLSSWKLKKPIQGKSLLLFRGSNSELEQILQAGLFSLIIPANQVEDENYQKLEIEIQNQTFYPPPVKGQGLLHFLHPFSKPNLIWLDKKWSNASTWKADFKEYDEKVKALFFAGLKSSETAEKSIYKGIDNCKNCHHKEHEIWKSSKHAHAWATLKQVNKQYDPECIVCHTLGFQKQGFISEKKTPHLTNVQCENCHGVVAEDHFAKPDFKKTRKKVTDQDCRTCHKGGHSPAYRFETYWPVIQH